MRGILASGRLRAMFRFLRGLGFLAYAFLLVLVFGLAAYTSFSLFVRSGVTTVPKVEGLSRAEAATLLADQGLQLRGVDGEGRYDDKVPVGHIARQTPDPRTLVKRGSGVTVVLSKGPRRVDVPELAGKSLTDAQFALSGAGLALGQILGVFGREESTPGSVLEQDPEPRSAIAPSTPVDLFLVVAVPRKRFVMPDLVYRDYELVRPWFERGGFRFGNVKYERYEGVAAGTILRQFPQAGHPVTQEEAISLVVATADIPVLGDEPLEGGPPAPEPPPPAPPAAGEGAEGRTR
ncbi:MAG: PASTA domain-containing protein [Thermoanaerobaculia bacterium]